MPSPFPGVDPYLEAPDIWPDFHDALAAEIRGVLNRTLPPSYYARLETRPEIGILAEPPTVRRVVPDVTVMSAPSRITGEQTASAVIDHPRTTVSPSLEVTFNVEPLGHAFVEIRDSSQGHRLITLIEIVSPSNKRPGQDRRTYLQKQREVLDTDANLIELDLLRDGERLVPYPQLSQIVSELSPAPDYLVMVNRWWLRMGEAMGCQLFAWSVHDRLPCIPIPLGREETDATLDLQWVFNQAYDRGPYLRGAIDYTRPPDPPLSAGDAAWAAELIRPLLKT